MSHDDIDLDRVIIDPAYRREVIDFLKATDQDGAAQSAGTAAPPDGAAADRANFA